MLARQAWHDIAAVGCLEDACLAVGGFASSLTELRASYVFACTGWDNLDELRDCS